MREEDESNIRGGQTDMDLYCADCGSEMNPPYDNGDGKKRCEPCAVKKFKGGHHGPQTV